MGSMFAPGGMAPNPAGAEPSMQGVGAAAPNVAGIQAPPPSPEPTPVPPTQAPNAQQQVDTNTLGALGAVEQSQQENTKAERMAKYNIGKAGKKEGDAIIAKGNTEQDANDEYIATLTQLAGKAQENDKLFRQNIDDAKKASTAQLQTAMTAAKEANNYQFHEYFADKSTLGKVMGVLSQAMAGAANGLAGTPGAPTPLDRIIERDMQLQMANYNKTKGNAEAQHGLYALLHEQLGDTLSAQLAYKTALTQQMQTALQTMQAKSAAPSQAAQVAAATLATKLATEQADLTKAMMAANTNAAHAESGVLMENAKLQVEMQSAADRLEAAKAATKAKSSTMSRQQANKLADTDNVVRRIDEVLSGSGHLNPSEQADLAELIATARSNSGTGPKGADREVAQQVVSGTLPSPKVLGVHFPIREWYTGAKGVDKETLRKIRAELLQKQDIRALGKGGMDSQSNE